MYLALSMTSHLILIADGIYDYNCRHCRSDLITTFLIATLVAQGIGGIWTQKSHDQNCTILAGMSKDFGVHLSLTLNFSY